MEVITSAVTNISGNTAVCGGEIVMGSGQISDYFPIVDRILMNKWKLYNKTRFKLVGTVKSLEGVTPFQLFEDREQADTPYVLTGLTYKVMLDQYDVELNEYDNTTDINLVEQ